MRAPVPIRLPLGLHHKDLGIVAAAAREVGVACHWAPR
jgi:hypothetical protein